MNEVLNNKKKSEILAEKIKELSYGDIISHRQISAIIDENYPSNKYTTTISKARKILLVDGIYLENIVGDGYRVVEPDKFVDASLKHYKRGLNEIQKGHDTLSYAPTKDMTSEGRSLYRKVYDRSTILQAAINGVSVELKALVRKKHPMMPENISHN